jgi:hypothetical protein
LIPAYSSALGRSQSLPVIGDVVEMPHANIGFDDA